MTLKLWLSLLSLCVLVVSSCVRPMTPEKIAARKEKQLRQEQVEFTRVGGLVGIRKIFLGDFGVSDGSDLVREKVRVLLSNTDRFEVAEGPTGADAIMLGAAGLEKRFSQGESSYAGFGVLRLKNAKTDKTIWNFEYQRGFMLGSSVSSRVAAQIVDTLLKDARAADAYAARRSLLTQ